MDAVSLSVDVRSALGNIKSSNVSLTSPASWVWDSMKLLGIIAEVFLVIVAGREVLVELVTSHADKRRCQQGLNVESWQVLWVEIRVLTLEVTAGVDGLENGFSIHILAVSGPVELPVIVVDNNSSVTRSSVVSVQNEGLEDLHVFDDKSTVLKNSFRIALNIFRRKPTKRREMPLPGTGVQHSTHDNMPSKIGVGVDVDTEMFLC